MGSSLDGNAHATESTKAQLLSELTAFMRHYHDLRFKHLTLYLVITGLLLTTLVDNDLGIAGTVLLRLAGMAITVVFYALEKRATRYWYGFRDKVRALESGQQGVSLFREDPAPGGFFVRPGGPSAVAAEAIYFAVFLVWLASFFVVPY